jgi:hypothetical protein
MTFGIVRVGHGTHTNDQRLADVLTRTSWPGGDREHHPHVDQPPGSASAPKPKWLDGMAMRAPVPDGRPSTWSSANSDVTVEDATPP